MADLRLEPEITCPECGRSAEEAVRTDATTTGGGGRGNSAPDRRLDPEERARNWNFVPKSHVLTPKSG